MARIISIGTTQHIDLIKAKLGRELKLFERDGLKINLEESPAGKFTFLSCCLVDFRENGCTEEDIQVILKNYIAEIISDIIMSHWEAFLLENIIRENYYYFGNEEKKIIYDYATMHINSKLEEEPWKSVYWVNRKNKILQKISEFLNFNNHIVIDGFIRFRLKEYLSELREAADKAVDDFLMEREYKEFIQLLKYFVEIQEPQIDIVHVLINSSGVFKLFDGNMRPIRSDCLGGFILDLMDSEVNYEDLLIGVLVTVAPKKITLHYKKDKWKQAMETINNVFAGRVNECVGCHLCNPLLNN
ncbi:MAG: YtxC-like family protein [Pelotomaculum sp. PtaU1.Bin035]|nr:MAG: YtxC-like family protein [Pelotomaculum sp. PtaU1.Bin035]